MWWRVLLKSLAVCPRCFSLRHQHSSVRVRFAPSPTGQLHIGGLRTALYNYLFARSNNGKFILRIEDTDQTRLVPGAMENLINSLQWAGINIDEGPTHGGDYGPYIQSERLKLYTENIAYLLKNGTAYRCFCTERRLDILRKEQLRNRETPKYDNRCRHLSESEISTKLAASSPHTVRLRMESHTEPWTDLVYGAISTDPASIEGDPVAIKHMFCWHGNQVLMKSDGFPTYHFANVVDDHLMRISHVLRGVEWQVSTSKHLLLYAAFGWQPPQFGHLPLLLNKDGKKLSKRHGDVHVDSYKNAGYLPEALLGLLTSTGAGFTIKDTAGQDLVGLANHFDLGLLKTNSTRINLDKVREYNRIYLQARMGDPATKGPLVKQVFHLITQTYGSQATAAGLTEDYVERVLCWALDRIQRLEDLTTPPYGYLWVAPPGPDITLLAPLTPQQACGVLQATLTALEGVEDSGWGGEMVGVLRAVAADHGLTVKEYMHLLRVSLSGLQVGPSVVEMMTILGRGQSVQRLRAAHEVLSQQEHASLQ